MGRAATERSNEVEGRIMIAGFDSWFLDLSLDRNLCDMFDDLILFCQVM